MAQETGKTDLDDSSMENLDSADSTESDVSEKKNQGLDKSPGSMEKFPSPRVPPATTGNQAPTKNLYSFDGDGSNNSLQIGPVDSGEKANIDPDVMLKQAYIYQPKANQPKEDAPEFQYNKNPLEALNKRTTERKKPDTLATRTTDIDQSPMSCTEIDRLFNEEFEVFQKEREREMEIARQQAEALEAEQRARKRLMTPKKPDYMSDTPTDSEDDYENKKKFKNQQRKKGRATQQDDIQVISDMEDSENSESESQESSGDNEIQEIKPQYPRMMGKRGDLDDEDDGAYRKSSMRRNTDEAGSYSDCPEIPSLAQGEPSGERPKTPQTRPRSARSTRGQVEPEETALDKPKEKSFLEKLCPCIFGGKGEG